MKKDIQKNICYVLSTSYCVLKACLTECGGGCGGCPSAGEVPGGGRWEVGAGAGKPGAPVPWPVSIWRDLYRSVRNQL